MKVTSYAQNTEELVLAAKAGVSDVLLSHEKLSRLGSASSSVLMRLAEEARNLNLRPVLDWDILMTQADFDQALSHIRELELERFSAIRVQDPGAFEWLLRQTKAVKIQLNLENGNPNLLGIQGWCDYGGYRLERIIVSSQIPKHLLGEIIQKINTPVEVLGLGPVLLLYTPRHLLSNLLGSAPPPTPPRPLQDTTQDRSLGDTMEDLSHWISATASSEESQHQGFRVRETPSGTLFFLSKDYCLLDQIDVLRSMNLSHLRIDLRLAPKSILETTTAPSSAKLLLDAVQLVQVEPGQDNRSQVDSFLSSYPTRVTRCFFLANQTDVLFKKLKNTRVQRVDRDYVGEIVEISKNRHLLLNIIGKNVVLRKGDRLKFVSPTGEEKPYPVARLMNLDQEDVSELKTGDFAVLHYMKLVPPKTAVYFDR